MINTLFHAGLMPVEILRNWFHQEKRKLPWRSCSSPYQVWVSEVMLQQTQVSVVIPYFHKWMARFPSLESLAASDLAEVIKHWEGLGYYSRARNLHRGAQYVCAHMGGILPEDPAQLIKIPGIGPYTIGAIRAFAFQQKAAAVDGNVLRVLSRYWAISEDTSRVKTQQQFRLLAENLLPDEKPWEITEALIELGALVCKKKPICDKCPLMISCKAHQQGIVHTLPVKMKPPAITFLYRVVPILISGMKVLIKRNPAEKLMAYLHEFPFFESSEEGVSVDHIVEKMIDEFGISATPLYKLPPVKHGFTRYVAHLEPWVLSCKLFKPPINHFWVLPDEMSRLAFSAGHRRILNSLKLPDSLKT